MFNSLFRVTTKKTSKTCITGPFEGNPPMFGGFPFQWGCNLKNYFSVNLRGQYTDNTKLNMFSSKFISRLPVISTTMFDLIGHFEWYRLINKLLSRRHHSKWPMRSYKVFGFLNDSLNVWSFVILVLTLFFVCLTTFATNYFDSPVL